VWSACIEDGAGRRELGLSQLAADATFERSGVGQVEVGRKAAPSTRVWNCQFSIRNGMGPGTDRGSEDSALKIAGLANQKNSRTTIFCRLMGMFKTRGAASQARLFVRICGSESRVGVDPHMYVPNGALPLEIG